MSRNYSSYQKTLNSFFDFNEGTKANNLSVKIKKKSKKLILDNITYSNYSTYYNKLTMIHSFKLFSGFSAESNSDSRVKNTHFGHTQSTEKRQYLNYSTKILLCKELF